MPFTTYVELKQAIINFSHRTDTAGVVDDFIDLTENDIDKKLRLRANEQRATASPTTRFLALPDRFIEMRRLSLINGSVTKDIQYKSPEGMAISGTSGEPRFFTITSQIEFDKAPSSTYTIEMAYYAGIQALSSSNTTNGVLTNYPDIYLFGALTYLSIWEKDINQAKVYKALFDEKLNDANKQERRGRYGPAPSISMEGWTP